MLLNVLSEHDTQMLYLLGVYVQRVSIDVIRLNRLFLFLFFLILWGEGYNLFSYLLTFPSSSSQ